ncbi:phage holin family protein [Chitinolyticbacter meiyuanensis]|uniref:phage holin family protein n=1 Tax=Chitinolyticbacter meiyuanensis TaxID=682798 RepID=UPI0011E5F38E|nr:phage holin family protein [Chitinolyticbacter meiyuanensis]
MSDSTSSPRPLHRLAAAIVGLLHAHLGIFSIELEEARERVLRTLILGVFGAGLLLLCLVSFAWALVLYLPHTSRIAMLAIFGAVFLLCGGICLWLAWRGVARGPQPFAATLEELRRDRERLL